jgi:membrane protein
VTLGAAILASFLLTAAASWAQAFLLRLLGWDDAPPWRTITAVTPVLVAVIADVAIFYLLYDQLSPRDVRAPRKALFRGALMAAVAFEVLKLGLTLLLPLLLTSATAKLFGPVIGLLFFFNLVATVVLFLAAWIATARTATTPAGPAPVNKLDHVEATAQKADKENA